MTTTIKRGSPMRLSTAPAPGPTLPPGSIPLDDLTAMLENHAAAAAIVPNTFMRPHGMPERINNAPVELIDAGRWQPRSVRVDVELNSLAESIQQHGIINPLVVFVNDRGRFELIAGERRLRAAKSIGLIEVPVQVIEGTPALLQELSVIENLQRENLTAPEEGAAFNRMISELGISEAELARKLGKNRAYIQQRRALASAAPEVQDALAKGEISFGVARGILAATDEHAVQCDALKEIMEKQIFKPVKEAGAKKITESAAGEALRKRVRDLGWKLEGTWLGSSHMSVTVLWSDNDRPREINETELAELLQNQTAPLSIGAPDMWEHDADFLSVIKNRGWFGTMNDTYRPWIYFGLSAENGGPKNVWLRGDEIPAFARRCQAEYDELTARSEACGYALMNTGNVGPGWQMIQMRGDQRTNAVYEWLKLIALISELEQGTAELRPRNRCAACGDFLDHGWIYAMAGRGRSEQIHPNCEELAQRMEQHAYAQEQRHDAAHSEQPIPIELLDDYCPANPHIPEWIANMPEEYVMALLWHMGDDDPGTTEQNQLRISIKLVDLLADYNESL